MHFERLLVIVWAHKKYVIMGQGGVYPKHAKLGS